MRKPVALTAATLLLALTACGEGESGGTNTDQTSNEQQERIDALEEQTDELAVQVDELGTQIDQLQTDAVEPGEDSEPEVTDNETEEDNTEVEASEGDGNPEVGDTWTWEDGLSVTLADVRPFEPSYPDVTSYDQHIVLDVTIENSTGENFDPNRLYMTASSGGQEAEAAYDSAQGLNGRPSTTLLDGQDVTFAFGYGVEDPENLTVEMRDTDWEANREPVIFVYE